MPVRHTCQTKRLLQRTKLIHKLPIPERSHWSPGERGARQNIHTCIFLRNTAGGFARLAAMRSLNAARTRASRHPKRSVDGVRCEEDVADRVHKAKIRKEGCGPPGSWCQTERHKDLAHGAPEEGCASPPARTFLNARRRWSGALSLSIGKL